jgi:hypothetical protein
MKAKDLLSIVKNAKEALEAKVKSGMNDEEDEEMLKQFPLTAHIYKISVSELNKVHAMSKNWPCASISCGDWAASTTVWDSLVLFLQLCLTYSGLLFAHCALFVCVAVLGCAVFCCTVLLLMKGSQTCWQRNCVGSAWLECAFGGAANPSSVRALQDHHDWLLFHLGSGPCAHQKGFGRAHRGT